MEGDYRRFVTFHHDEVQAIRQREFANLLFERLQVLRGHRKRGPQQEQAQRESFHDILWLLYLY
jgi:hypothetical protein